MKKNTLKIKYQRILSRDKHMSTYEHLQVYKWKSADQCDVRVELLFIFYLTFSCRPFFSVVHYDLCN